MMTYEEMKEKMNETTPFGVIFTPFPEHISVFSLYRGGGVEFYPTGECRNIVGNRRASGDEVEQATAFFLKAVANTA